MSKAATLLYFRSLLWWCGLMAASVWADPLPMPLTAGVGVQSAAAHIEYLPETVERDARSVFRVPAARWQHDTGTPNLGFTTQAYWFRVQVHSHDRVDGFLAITYPVLDDVRVHELDVHGRLLAEYRFGDLQPNPALQIPNRYFLTPLRLAAGEQRIFLMRVATQGSLQLPLSYFDRQHFYDREQQVLLLEGVYFGILLIMVVYNFFIFMVLREPSYVWYSLFVLTFLVFQVSLEGFGYQFLWRYWPQVNSFILPFCISACMCSGAVFSLRFLGPGAAFPRITGLFRLTALAGVLGMLVSLSGAYGVAVRFSVASAGVMALFAIGAGFYLWRQGVSHARYYALGWSFLMPTIVIFSLNKQGLLPVNFFTDYAIQMGSVIEATLFSFALGDRIALERRAKIEEQAALLERERTLRAELQASHRQELLAQQKMVAAEAESRAKTRFLATMSHEIRTPLNGVLGMIELLQASGLAPAQRKYADVIARSGQTLLSVINDILDFSKISAGKMQLEELDFDLEQLCTECAGTFSYSAEKNGIALEVRYAADVPVFVHGDPARIRQILLNLLGNAFKFTERGRVELQVSRVLQHGKECLHLAVSDTGIGISEDMQGQLFDSFAQADVSTTRRYGGTGLGLAISKQLSLLMGGDMGLQSRAGEGSTFWFSLPCHPADTAPMMRQGQDLQAHAFPAPGYPGRTVLVVDDNEVNLTVITAILKKLDIRVLQARGGEQAVAYAGHHHDTLDLILMDCEMPGLDGFAATRRIRAQEAADGLPAVPIVALTAHALPEYQTRCLESGMTGYLAKPVQVRVLAARLAKIWAIGPD